jgi:translation initiation factor IF-2
MTEPVKNLRLAAVAKECNVGVAHIVDLLKTKGFDVENKPTTKLTDDMYLACLKEYNADAAAKMEASSVNFNKGQHNVVLETKKNDEFIGTNKPKEDDQKELVIKSTVVLQGPTVVGKLEKPAPKKAEPKKEEEKPLPVIDELREVKFEQKAEPVIEKIASKKVNLAGPKVVGKLENLDDIPDSTKPADDAEMKKKGGKKKKVTEEEKPVAKVAPEPIVEEKPAIKVEPTIVPKLAIKPVNLPPVAPKPSETISSTIQEVRFAQKGETPAEPEKIETRRVELTGPKVLSKIDLSKIDDSTKPIHKPDDRQHHHHNNNNNNNKQPRKRIQKPERLKPITDSTQSPAPPRKTITLNPGGAPQQGGFNRGNDRRPKRVDAPVDEKAIQEKIRNTLAQLSGGTSKSKQSKYRKEKRQAHADAAAAEAEASGDGSILNVTEFISVSELAAMMNKSATDVIMACMSLGVVVSINQRLDAELIEVVTSEFGYEAKFISMEENDSFDDEDDAPEDLKPRPPIVTIMGHVDHGKTSLLDYIRNANVVAGEAGGITQHIGAYEVTLPSGKEITFLDTPGHEAFTAMRARGAKVTDIAVIVVSADDSVMPQTKEAISHAQAANVPIIFAINKIDKDGANPDQIRQQLSGMNILVESWGGKIQEQEISAKKGLNIDKLLEKILLEAEMLDMKANADKPAMGSVIEATLDKGRGYVATILVQEGTLNVGDMMVAGSQYGRIKAMTDERGNRKVSAGPSTPVQILGLDGAPQAGEKFKVFHDEQVARDLAIKRQQIMREQGYRTKKHITLDEIGRRLALGNFKQLNVLVKADVDGSVEALSDSLIKLSNTEIQVNVVLKAVGQISESDVLLASASDAIVIGFNVRPSLQARKLAEQENIEIKNYSIIYDAINDLKNAIEGMMEPTMEEKILCNIEIKEVFKITKVGTIAGCQVLDGKLTRNTKVRIVREGIVVYSGELASLKRFKDDAKEVSAGMECGLGIKNFNDIKVGDIVEGYEQVEVKKKLGV